MTRWRTGTAAAAAVAAVAGFGLATASPASTAPYREGPPVAHTGGFGEATCQECHFGSPVNAEPGRVRVLVPESVEAGQPYELTVALDHPDMAAAGFQLAVRFADGNRAGRQAGVLSPASRAVTVTVDTTTGVVYAHQSLDGALPTDGRAAWRIGWTPPAMGPDGVADVVVHVAANAANDDASEFGDRVYTDSVRARVAPPR